MAQIGQLNQRCVVERRTVIIDDYGVERTDAWVAHAGDSLWCRYSPTFASKELVDAGRLNSAPGGVLVLRYSSATISIDPAMRVRMLSGPYAGRVFGIMSVVAMENRRWVELALIEDTTV